MTDEAAERLLDAIAEKWPHPTQSDPIVADFRAALAAERKAGRDEAIDSFTDRIDGLLADERLATAERMRPFFEDMADSLDTEGYGVLADNLRATWRLAHDATVARDSVPLADPEQERRRKDRVYARKWRARTAYRRSRTLTKTE